jgi:hypothetical protein
MTSILRCCVGVNFCKWYLKINFVLYKEKNVPFFTMLHVRRNVSRREYITDSYSAQDGYKIGA